MRQEGTVLYDAPGPRTRRLTLIGSVVAAVAVLALGYFFVYLPLDELGQFSMELWGPLVDPSNPYFKPIWKQLGIGLRNTLIAAVCAIISSLVFGSLLAALRLQLRDLQLRRYAGLPAAAAWALRGLTVLLSAVTRFFIEVFRGLPVVTTIFFVAVALPRWGVTLDNLLWYLVIGLTLYNGVVIGEILRSGMDGLPRGQREAAQSIGLSPFQTTRLVLLPQSYRIMLPALISQMVVILKDTSLGFIISYSELLRTATLLIGGIENDLGVAVGIQMYTVVGVIYIVINYLLSKLAQYVQRRVARGRRTAAKPDAVAPPAAVAPELA